MTFLTIFGFHFKNLGEFPTQLDLDVLGGSTSQPARPPPPLWGCAQPAPFFQPAMAGPPSPEKFSPTFLVLEMEANVSEAWERDTVQSLSGKPALLA